LKLHITIDGKTYEADVEIVGEEEEETPLPPAHAPHPPAAFAPVHPHFVEDPNARDCRSPVMGLVIRVNVKPGQAIAAGELIVVIEAMKMQTNVVAPRAATVKTVHIAPGDPVKMHQPLVEFE
jgi:methylmalonyl-CoA carboxyltransferase small subunit